MLDRHLFGLYEKALDPADDWPTRLKKTQELGFDFMELSIDETDERLERLYWPTERWEYLRRVCTQTGVPLQSMCLSAHRRFPFGSADPIKRAKAYEIMERAITFSVALGIRVIQLAGYDVYYEPSTPESVRRFREGLVWSVREAGRRQVMLAMEIMDTPFLNSISKNMGYEAMLRSPWYRVYPDIGNLSAWPENDVDFEIRQGFGSIVGIHLKDTLAAVGGSAGTFKQVPFGVGCVDFPRRFAQLAQLGYTGPYVMEMWHAEGSDDMERVRRAKAWMEEQYEAGRGLAL